MHWIDRVDLENMAPSRINTYMKYKDIPENAIKTRTGFKLHKNNIYGWDHFEKLSCTYCNKQHYKRVIYGKRKHNIHFCSNICQTNYNHQNRDPKGANILQNINNLDFYYLLGLICTDGHISWPKCTKSATSYECFICLQRSDNELIQKINNLFGGIIINRKNITKWTLRNKFFIDFLRTQVNIGNRKSQNLGNIETWFNQLNIDQKLNFIRGCFDGDGYISKSKYQTWTICSISKDFLVMLQQFLQTLCKDKKRVRIMSSKYGTNKFMHFLAITQKDCLKEILPKLYSTGTLYLQRKHDRIEKQIPLEVNNVN